MPVILMSTLKWKTPSCAVSALILTCSVVFQDMIQNGKNIEFRFLKKRSWKDLGKVLE